MTMHALPPPSGSAVYPGEYTALPEAAAIIEIAENKCNTYPPKLSVNMTRGQECIVVESALPGSSRSNIYISGYENLLCIYVLHSHKDHSSEKIQLHEINDEECLQRFIMLPGNTDPEFGSAGYRDGILRICIPVSKHPLPLKNFRIIVY